MVCAIGQHFDVLLGEVERVARVVSGSHKCIHWLLQDNSLNKEKGKIDLRSRKVVKAQEKQSKYPFAFEITGEADDSNEVSDP